MFVLISLCGSSFSTLTFAAALGSSASVVAFVKVVSCKASEHILRPPMPSLRMAL